MSWFGVHFDEERAAAKCRSETAMREGGEGEGRRGGGGRGAGGKTRGRREQGGRSRARRGWCSGIWRSKIRVENGAWRNVAAREDRAAPPGAARSLRRQETARGWWREERAREREGKGKGKGEKKKEGRKKRVHRLARTAHGQLPRGCARQGESVSTDAGGRGGGTDQGTGVSMLHRGARRTTRQRAREMVRMQRPRALETEARGRA